MRISLVLITLKLCGNFGTAKRWKNCPATVHCYAVSAGVPHFMHLSGIDNTLIKLKETP